MVDTEKLYELKKALRKLGALKGSGTEMISVYIPAGSPMHEMAGKLREEMSQAGNIKSKSTKTNVLGALERILQHLKIYKHTPGNGIAIFCGNISDNPSKVDIELFSIEPPQPLQIGAYRCDSRFFLEPLEKMGAVTDSYGIVVMDGREATLALMRGTQITIVKRLNSMAHAKIRKGGQCLAAGTLVQKADGEIIGIENFKPGARITGMDFSASKTLDAAASDFFVTPARHSLLIETKWPCCEIRATPYHRFFVLSEHGVKEKFAKDLDEKDRILVARKINCLMGQRRIDYKITTRIALDDAERRKLRDARIRLGISQKKAAEIAGLTQMVISYLETGKQTPSDEHLRKIYRMYGIRFDGEKLARKTLRFPEYWDGGIARLLGVICGDGSEDGGRIIIYEGSRELADDYRFLIRKTIGIEPVVRTVDKTGQRGSFAKKEYFEIRIHSTEFVRAVRAIAGRVVAKERDVPSEITKCDNGVVAAFLSGLYDAEGYIHGNRVDIAMVSKSLMQKVQLLLLRFGILSSFTEKRVSGRRQWLVSISDRDSLVRFRENIGFTRSDKNKKLSIACSTPAGQQYMDQIPVDGREVFRLAEEAGLKTSDFHAASCFFRNKKPLGRRAFARNILAVFAKHAETKRGKEILGYLNRIYQSDLTFARLKSKIHVADAENFYDITVPVHSNFIANGLVVHNSARRYERLIEESIEKYYIRVGLAMDEHFLGIVKGVIVGGPGPTKDFFMKAKPFNYQFKVLGVVDTGYTDEYGIREVLAKSNDILAEQEAVKERILVERFIKEISKDGLATYGVKEVRGAILSKQADMVLLSEGLDYNVATYFCNSCNEKEDVVLKGEAPDRHPCSKCKGDGKLVTEEPLIENLAALAKENNIKVEILSTNTVEGSQFLQGFAGIGAFLRYRL